MITPIDSSQKGGIGIAAIFGVLLVAVIVGGSYYSFRKSEREQAMRTPIPTPLPSPYVSATPIPSFISHASSTPVPSSVATLGWKTYTNSAFGFSLQYPPEFTLGALGPNQTQLDLEAGREPSSAASPSYDTITFNQSGKTIWSVEIFHTADMQISEANFEKSHLNSFGSCGGVVRSKELRMLAIYGTPMLSVAITRDVSNGIDIVRQYNKCYYLKNKANNILVFSFSMPSQVEFTVTDVLLQRALNTVKLTNVPQ